MSRTVSRWEEKEAMAAGARAEGASKSFTPQLILGLLLAVLFWAYWNSLTSAARYWDNPKYSHGYLVPLFTLILLWLRRDLAAPLDSKLMYIGGGLMALAGLIFGLSYTLSIPMAQASLLELLSTQLGVIGALIAIQQPLPDKVAPSARWAGVGLLMVGLTTRMLGTFFPNVTPELYSFVPAVMGLFLLVGGWETMRWAGAPLAFLVFMFPLPNILDQGLLAPLQKLATEASTYCLQTLGIPAVNEFNKIVLGGETTMEVVEACSGLRMLTIFVALAVAIAMVTERPLWEKLVIIASSVPIALAVNIIRITVTGIMYLTVGPETADKMFHAMLGWFMIPTALGLLYLEFQVLSHLFIDDGLAGPVPINIGAANATSTR